MKKFILILLLVATSLATRVTPLHADGGGPGCAAGFLCGGAFANAWKRGVETAASLANDVTNRWMKNVMNIPVPSGALGWTTVGSLMGDVMRVPGVSRGMEIAGEAAMAVPLPILQGVGQMAGPALEYARALGQESIAVRAVIGGIEGSQALLPTLPDALIPEEMRAVAIENIPRRAIQNVNKLLGRKLGQGMEGEAYEMAGDPTRVVKVYYKSENVALGAAKDQMNGLLRLEEDIARAGLQDKMEVVKTLEYGVDAQGRAFTVHPRIVGELLTERMNPALAEEVVNINKILQRGDPIAQKLIQGGMSEDFVARMSVLNNYFRTPAGKWIVIDPK